MKRFYILCLSIFFLFFSGCEAFPLPPFSPAGSAENTESVSGSSGHTFSESFSETENEPETKSENPPENESTPENIDISGPNTLTVQFIDVGQGDAALIRLGDHAMMIDGGPRSASQKIYSILASQGITHLDYLISSHPDEDHIGGLSAALNFSSVDFVFTSPPKRAPGPTRIF